MIQTFTEKWLEAVDKKNSVLCAGLDPAEYEMGRGDEGFKKGEEKLIWAQRYIEAVAPFCAAVKPNVQYWKGRYGMDSLLHITREAHQHGMLVIDDSKLADIGSTNDAGMYHTQDKKMDAITLACFAGNIKEAAGQLRAREIGGIHMCLMSNPDYAREKNKLVPLTPEERVCYNPEDIKLIDDIPHVKQYIQLVSDSQNWGLEGVVIGAPSKKNHITEQELAKARYYTTSRMLVLLPGVGAQGGEADAIWKYFAKDHVIVNVGRAVMFPKGSNSTPKDQAEAARLYQQMLNQLRAA